MAHEHKIPHDHSNADPTSQLDVLILLHGTRGDIQPYLRIARLLRETYGHRVRLAAAPAYEHLVSVEYGIEFFSTGHDLAPFIDFDQRTKTFSSKVRAMVNGELNRLKKQQADIFDSHWLACIDGVEDNKRPFIADAIISNPVAWTPISLAQRLGIPLFLLHANPRTPTRAWPHSASNPSDTVLVECDQNFKSWRDEESKYVSDSKYTTQLKANPHH
jgi:UDP:flavonoid glycosyltransferase YjiC (YdhE family)